MTIDNVLLLFFFGGGSWVGVGFLAPGPIHPKPSNNDVRSSKAT